MAVPALAALEMRRLRLLDGDAGIDRAGGQEVCSVRVRGPARCYGQSIYDLYVVLDLCCKRWHTNVCSPAFGRRSICSS